LSIKENEVLLAFDQEEDWLLVQSQDGGKAGFVPANYVEVP
jgi:actin cytoskeleton-regulatory complex protein SLA1